MPASIGLWRDESACRIETCEITVTQSTYALILTASSRHNLAVEACRPYKRGTCFRNEDAMILTCPSCSSRYAVDSQALGASGRYVRCSNCQHTWFQEPAADAPKPVDLTPRPSLAGYDSPLPPGSNLPAFPPGKKKRGGGAIWFLLIAIVFGGLTAAVMARNDIVRFWPQAAQFYALAGLTGWNLGDGLDLRDVAPVRREDTGTVAVQGRVVNIAGEPRPVPKLRATVTSAQGQVLKEWSFASGATILMPGESHEFHQDLPDMPRGGAQMAVTFSDR